MPSLLSGDFDTYSIVFHLPDFKVADSGKRFVSETSTSSDQCVETREEWGEMRVQIGKEARC